MSSGICNKMLAIPMQTPMIWQQCCDKILTFNAPIELWTVIIIQQAFQKTHIICIVPHTRRLHIHTKYHPLNELQILFFAEAMNVIVYFVRGLVVSKGFLLRRLWQL